VLDLKKNEKYVAMFRKCDKSKAYLNKMYHSLLDKMNFLILEMRTSEIRTFRNVYVNALAKEILEAENYIYIISGELCSTVWNSSAIIKAISETKAKHIKILCGPEIDLKSTAILKLVAKGRIDLFYSKKRNKKHFVLTEKALFMEKGHRTFDFSDEILMTRKEAGLIISYYKKAFEAKTFFKKRISEENILEKFSPRIFKLDAKENNKEPTLEDISNFKCELGIKSKNALAN